MFMIILWRVFFPKKTGFLLAMVASMLVSVVICLIIETKSVLVDLNQLSDFSKVDINCARSRILFRERNQTVDTRVENYH